MSEIVKCENCGDAIYWVDYPGCWQHGNGLLICSDSFEKEIRVAAPAAQPATDKEKVLKVYPDARCVVATATDDYEHRGYVYWIEGTPFKVKTKFASPEQAWRSAASRLPTADGEEKGCIHGNKFGIGNLCACALPQKIGQREHSTDVKPKKFIIEVNEPPVPASAEGKLPELPLLSWTAAQKACEGGYKAACEERESQLTAALAEIERLKPDASWAATHRSELDDLRDAFKKAEAEIERLRNELALWRSEHDPCPFSLELEELRQSLQTTRHDALEEACAQLCPWCRAGHTPRACSPTQWTHAAAGEDVWTKDKTCRAAMIRSLQSTEGK